VPSEKDHLPDSDALEVVLQDATENDEQRYVPGNILANRKPEHYPTGGRSSQEEADLLATRALRMRMMGASYPEIARALGYTNHSSARHAVRRAMEDDHSEDAKQARELELRRLDRLLMAMWPKLVAETANSNPDDLTNLDRLTVTEWMQLIDRYFKLQKARAELMGLDAPTEVDISYYVRQRAEAEGIEYEDIMREVEHIMAASEAGSSLH